METAENKLTALILGLKSFFTVFYNVRNVKPLFNSYKISIIVNNKL
jgi:hypothetical protein